MSRNALLVGLLLAAGALWVTKNWDEIQTRIGIEDTAEVRAVEIAKKGRTLRVDRTNAAVLEDQAHRYPDNVTHGWKTQPISDRIVVVSFTWTEDDELMGRWFEVDVGSTKIRDLEYEPELRERYGVPPR